MVSAHLRTTHHHGSDFLRIAIRALTSMVIFTAIADAQENIGTIRQALVGGAPVAADIQQKMGLVTLSMGCSAVLIRQNWVLTAAHCVDKPGGPEGFIKRPDNSITVTLNGTGRNPEVRQSVQIITFRPNDVAIIRVETPFTGNEFNNREIYTGPMINQTIRFFGRGIFRFSENGMPSIQDGQYRYGFFNVDKEGSGTFTYSSRNGVSVAGGDSGGPSFVKGHSLNVFGAADLIAGVHSLCGAVCAVGKSCAMGTPHAWDWVTAVPYCADASIAPVWPKILKLLTPPVQPVLFAPTSTQSEILYTVKSDGTLWWQDDLIHLGAIGNMRTVLTERVAHEMTGPVQVGTGWSSAMDIVPGGSSTIYILQRNGDLQWYRHDGYLKGVMNWAGPINVGSGWNAFTKIIPMGDGVLYGILPDGTLRWNKHNNYKTGQGGSGGWAQPAKDVAEGWKMSKFKFVVGGGNGVFYVVTNDGKLYWYRHIAYRDPVAKPRAMGTPEAEAWSRTWEGPKEIGTGWGGFTKIFCAGHGHIYGVLPSGELRGYDHTGWQDGSANWGEQVKIGDGWNSYLFIFPAMPSSAPQDDIRVQ